MLQVKHLTLLSQTIEKGREILPRLQKKSILIKIWFSIESDFRALALILIELWPFSPHNI